MKKTPLISIITPCFNESENVLSCYLRTKEIMSKVQPKVRYEHIFADNSSTDNTLDILKEIAAQDSSIKIISNSINVGPFRNMFSAIKFCTGDAIIPMLPADLQDPPEIIPEFIELWRKGNLVIFGKRIKRSEIWTMRIFRKLYYYLINRFASAEIPQGSGEFMLIDHLVAQSLVKTNDHYPYIRGMVAQMVGHFEVVSYKWNKRKFGKSKSNLLSLFDQAMNGLISTSRAPARFSILIGFLASLFGLVAGLVSLLLNILNHNASYQGIPTLIVTLFIFGGIQLFFLGLIGEYVLSIHQQVRRNPDWIILEKINFDNK